LRADGLYALKTQGGVLPKAGVAVVRINSDILTYPETAGIKRREKFPAAGGRYVGLLLMFSTTDGAPLMICPDAVMQRMRVGATNAIAAKYLGPKAVRRAAIIGSSGQAEAQLLGLAALYPMLDEIRVFSPNAEHRARFAASMRAKTGKDVHPFESGAAACKGAELVACATNALQPVFFKEWVERGMHVSSISSSSSDIEPAALEVFDRVAVFNHADYVLAIATHGMKRADGAGSTKPSPDLPTLPEIVAGRAPGRMRADETTCFVNNLGMGYQFAATGALVYQKARAAGLGRELPTEWFTENQAS
jgi:ornithine cyclodeaminase/alanine dehydrogenase-like protein (mu-crystallin family)